MGLYDSIYLKVKCPYCKETSIMEFQTKEGRCGMYSYRKGHKFDKGQFRRVEAYGTCDSLTCQLEAAKESVWTAGYYGGFPRGFDVIIYCDEKGKITGKIKIIKLCSHRGTMKGKLGELKEKEDNMKVVRYGDYDKKKRKWIEAKLKPMTTDGWLDKFRKDTFDNEKYTYKAIMYLYNLEDGEEAFKLWFLFRYRLERIIEILKGFSITQDKEFASVFLSNEPCDIYKLGETKNE